jgi:dCTP diphosphatase
MTDPAAPQDPIADLAQALKQFAQARDWQPFHSPKNLACALSVEAAELLEHFQWLTEEQSRNLQADQREAVALEMADVLLYLVQMASSLNLDLVDAARRKMAINEHRFPALLRQSRATDLG